MTDSRFAAGDDGKLACGHVICLGACVCVCGGGHVDGRGVLLTGGVRIDRLVDFYRLSRPPWERFIRDTDVSWTSALSITSPDTALHTRARTHTDTHAPRCFCRQTCFSSSCVDKKLTAADKIFISSVLNKSHLVCQVFDIFVFKQLHKLYIQFHTLY